MYSWVMISPACVEEMGVFAIWILLILYLYSGGIENEMMFITCIAFYKLYKEGRMKKMTL